MLSKSEIRYPPSLAVRSFQPPSHQSNHVRGAFDTPHPPIQKFRDPGSRNYLDHASSADSPEQSPVPLPERELTLPPEYHAHLNLRRKLQSLHMISNTQTLKVILDTTNA